MSSIKIIILIWKTCTFSAAYIIVTTLQNVPCVFYYSGDWANQAAPAPAPAPAPENQAVQQMNNDDPQ